MSQSNFVFEHPWKERATVDDLIAQFVTGSGHTGWKTPRTAMGACRAASEWFCRALAAEGFHPVLVRCDEWTGEFERTVCAGFWITAHPQDIHHYVVRVDGRVFDWTARQFNSDAAYPEIGTMRDLSTTWRLVSDVCRYHRTYVEEMEGEDVDA